MTRRRGLIADDGGHATVLGAFVIAALAAVLVMVIYVGAAVLARHRAQSAADLSALAAAIEHAAGEPNPCAAARDLSRRQDSGAELVECRTAGDDVVVTVRVPVALGSFGTSDATVQARAGPVD
ncbi:flp pilus-assembly TadE/G-like family protein [Gordonia hongkongensis]|uniref:Flp pilus-assembly TadE/G-like family protein n=1 Tax=Gordonia hongkongensis TaxID=1701090 RepID=A0AAX3T874_9ACTN|nr:MULTISPECIES: Rv3654c family TadE-like protein [Gordonia]QIK49672.1 flp pilus-assembly TadE/G-like family protein [Gordonia terrae]MCT1351820.1 flp pilus-assembly TadE/G-like family protein [Gordonia sp. p3-SID1431]MDF6102520.1 flp pilus-assembly TadE/G-like family protein [Gordonia hongkongensis]WFP25395.1 flp pilus-assembly TadE/G-like family protein [Gordonia hongkongensis]WGJ86086.1 flp pilus-assembly TadE/G-like family protein [Gordonia sp. SMJS1]